MSLETFPDIGAPDWGLGEQSQDSITQIQFGDGYEIRNPDGINFRRDGWSPSWSFLDPVVAETTYAWLKERKNLTAFLWEHPVYGLKKVVCRDVNMGRPEYNNGTLQASFVEDFNP